MNIPYLKQIRQHAPALSVLLVCGSLTVLAYLSEQRHAQERIALHASADAAQSQRTLQDGVDAYIHLNRSLAAYFTAAGHPSARAFDVFMKTADVLREHPGLSYIGYIRRIERGANPRFEQFAPADDPGLTLRTAGADPAYYYPYLYAYPLDARSRQSKGSDFSLVPERWAAMQQARDSGLSTATAKHFYATVPTTMPIILVFTPIYDAAMPAATVAQRRAALRGFVFSIFHIEEMIERVMGKGFHALFDLEIYDGAVRQENILYDGDQRPHVLLSDKHMPIAREADVTVANRTWRLFFYPKAIYVERYRSWTGPSILLAGFGLSAALAALMWRWTRRTLARSHRQADDLQFDAVFGNHPLPVYSLDRQRRFLNANAQALKEFKFDKAELLGKSVEQLIVPEKQAQATERFNDTLRGNSVSYHSTIIDGAGARVEISVIMLPVRTDSEVTSVLGLAQNITAQKLAEARLQESRKMLQMVIDHIPQRVFWKDPQLVFLGCNEAFCRDAGLSRPDEIIGRTDFDLAWSADAQQYRQDDIATLASGRARINYEEPQHRADGSVSWLRTSKIPLTDMQGNTVALLGLYEDITARKDMEQQLRTMAHHDNLTGLANRAFFYQHVTQAVAKIRRQGSQLALMYFDIDHFKAINDTYGHDAGDALLKAFSERVIATVREMDVFARLGGDEFALLLQDLRDSQAAEKVAQKLVEAMQAPFLIGTQTMSVTTSIGVAFFQQGSHADDVIKRADQAMYNAKRGGRNRFEIAR
jgi:diguanylate cyclase (GGDEF)-like protein/PAS domain S-box-containing protein